jgi:hypothetical protein
MVKAMSNLPKEITEGMVPILAKYGITDRKKQGECMVAIGHIFQRSNIDGVARGKMLVKDWAFKVSVKIVDVLGKHGVPLEQCADCSKEIMAFVAELFKEVSKHGSR